MPGCPDPAVLADRAAGDGDRYDGVGDDELIGVLSAWDRLKAHMAARKLAAAAELIRRRPEPGCPPEGAARLPGGWEEFTAEELGYALAGHRGRAADLLTLAAALAGRLPGTRAALRDGIIRLDKAWIIAAATALLDPGEARAAEAMVLGRAGLSWRRQPRRRARAGGAGRPGWAPGRRAGRERGAGRVRRADQPDHPAGHPARPGRPARRDRRHRPHRPGSRSKYIGSLPNPGISRPRYPAHQHAAPLPVAARPSPMRQFFVLNRGLAGLIAECSGACVYDGSGIV